MSRTSPDNVLLGLLETESCHGYQLLEHFRQPNALGLVWKLSTSQLYALLKRLEHAELIDGREETSKDAPMRTVYWLTDAGRYQFNLWLNTKTPSASTRAIRTEFISRVYVAGLLKRPLRPIINAQITACEAYRDDLLQQCAELETSIGLYVLNLQVGEMSMILDWLTTFNVKAEL